MTQLSKQTWLAIIVAAMALATAWAIRGQFGHEQGAAWAGGIACLSVILIAGRKDWYPKAIKAAFAGAVGWGLGGMMSYGVVVGYGRGIEFINVYYGLLMLLVIGGLYGFVGGGLFGLVLADNSTKKIKWHQVIMEMTVGGIIFYYFIIEQLGIKMTPPRSEAWGVCAGIGIALWYYMVRTKQRAALKVAVFSGLGAGFGFALGIFMMVVGYVAEIGFNMWNVMEYSLGFFGGIGMAYATFTSKWEAEESQPLTNTNVIIPLVGLALLIPFIVWQQSFIEKDLTPTLSRLAISDVSTTITIVQWVAILSLVTLAVIWIRQFYALKQQNLEISRRPVNGLFIGYFGLYILYTLLITGSFASLYRIEQFLYIANFAVILWATPKLKVTFVERPFHPSKWAYTLVGIILVLAVLALISINIHGEIPGMNRRFEVN